MRPISMVEPMILQKLLIFRESNLCARKVSTSVVAVGWTVGSAVSVAVRLYPFGGLQQLCTTRAAQKS